MSQTLALVGFQVDTINITTAVRQIVALIVAAFFTHILEKGVVNPFAIERSADRLRLTFPLRSGIQFWRSSLQKKAKIACTNSFPNTSGDPISKRFLPVSAHL